MTAEAINTCLLKAAKNVLKWEKSIENGQAVGFEQDVAYAFAEFEAAINAADTAQNTRVEDLEFAVKTLLASHGCLAPNGLAEIPEEISAQFDINLDDATRIAASL